MSSLVLALALIPDASAWTGFTSPDGTYQWILAEEDAMIAAFLGTINTDGSRIANNHPDTAAGLVLRRPQRRRTCPRCRPRFASRLRR